MSNYSKNLYLYDSYSQSKKIIKDKFVKIYCCGPTVYNHVHIGNLRPLITFDVLVRFLLATKHRVKYISNITDVDDKIITKAAEEKTTEKKVSQKYCDAYFDLAKKLNVRKIDVVPKVMENIQGIIDYVEKLVKKNKGYVSSDGDVYFDINSVKKYYGKLSKQKISDLLNGVRKENNSEKKSPLDFVLWKKTNVGVNWKSPWNNHGRPGWHTECSYFVNKYFGNNGVTIHGGGIDLKFPHHENENAQNIALTNKQMSKNWMHVGHIMVNNEKMSKSLNNFVLGIDILKVYDVNTIRWFFLQTQYENPINYSNANMELARSEINKLFKTLNSFIFQLYLNGIVFKEKKVKLSEKFIEIMNNDLNFPGVVTLIYDETKSLPSLLKEKKFKIIEQTINQVILQLSILGIVYNLKLAKYIPDLKKWKKANEEKDYATGDKIREKLANI